MAEHLSALELDVRLTGGTLEPARLAHLDGCADCRQRLEREQAAAESVRALPGHDATLKRILESAPTAKVIPLSAAGRGAAFETAGARFRRRAPVLIAAALAIAASVVLLVSPPRDEETRLKGAASVELIGADGQALTAAKVGDRVKLAVGAAGKPFALVFSVDERGAVEPLWPPSGGSGPAPRGARAELTGFEVTAGSVTLVGLFTDRPLALAEGKGAVMSALRDGRVPERLELPGISSAVTRLEVSR